MTDLEPDVDARVRLAFVGFHPLRRRALEDRLGGPTALVEAVLTGRVEVPAAARAAAGVTGSVRLVELGDVRLVLDGALDYPLALTCLPDRPDALFVRGPIPDPPAVAIVGSRAATTYGLGVAERLAHACVAAGFPVISGLAKGIDAAAHRGAMRGGGPTAAVLGCGIDVWYPVANRGLGEEVLASGGVVLSEYPPGVGPAPWRFPLRNRIVSGLAAVVVVVEARVTGGALITARAALAQGREVMAVPGDIDRATSEGANRLIADGAVPVISVDEALEAIDLVTGRRRQARDVAPHPLAGLLGQGATLDDLADHLEVGIGDVLATIGRWEVEGLVRLEGDRVVPL